MTTGVAIVSKIGDSFVSFLLTAYRTRVMEK